MSPERRRSTPPSPDHDLLVRIDEKLLHLSTAFRETTEKNEHRINALMMEKADKVEIAEIKALLEEKLPKASIDSFDEWRRDHETRMRHLEKIVYKGTALYAIGQVLFNVWISLRIMQ